MTTDGRTDRMALWGDHFERTFRVLDFSTEVGGRAGEVCALLNDCFPAGTRRDQVGATTRQVALVLTLADLNETETADFFDVIACAGGISSQQAHHLISKLKGR